MSQIEAIYTFEKDKPDYTQMLDLGIEMLPSSYSPGRRIAIAESELFKSFAEVEQTGEICSSGSCAAIGKYFFQGIQTFHPRSENIVGGSQSLALSVTNYGTVPTNKSERLNDPFINAESRSRRLILEKALELKEKNPRMTWKEIAGHPEVNTPVRTLSEWRRDPRYKPD